MDKVLTAAAQQLEKQLDSEIERLDNLTVDDIDAIREKRLKEMKQRQEKIIQWKAIVRNDESDSFDHQLLKDLSSCSLPFCVALLGPWRIFRIGRREGIL
jgi:hypothetical protein